jgi:hypothetical protein
MTFSTLVPSTSDLIICSNSSSGRRRIDIVSAWKEKLAWHVPVPWIVGVAVMEIGLTRTEEDQSGKVAPLPSLWV